MLCPGRPEEPDKSESRMQIPECRMTGLSELWTPVSELCTIRSRENGAIRRLNAWLGTLGIRKEE